MKGWRKQRALDHCISHKVPDISRGSVVTRLRYGGLISDFIANLPLSLTTKKIENRSAFCEVTHTSTVALFSSQRLIMAQFFAQPFTVQQNNIQ